MLISSEPLHPDEVAARHQEVIEQNEARERERIARTNRSRGIVAPRVGDVLRVSTARGIKRRNRGGVRFDEGAAREVVVVESDPTLLARQRAGEAVVSVDGAEQILGDSALNVGAAAIAAPHDFVPREQHEAEIATLTAQLAAARRQAGPDPGDGTSSRLKAAQRARETGEFGAPPIGSSK